MENFLLGLAVGFFVMAFLIHGFYALYDYKNKNNPMVWVRKDKIKQQESQ